MNQFWKIKEAYTSDIGVSDIQISSDHDELHFCISQVTIPIERE